MRNLLDDRVISERYFFPRNDAPSAPWVVETSGQRLACIRAAKHVGPAVLHFHGNGEVASDWSSDFADALSAAGIDAYFGEYRGYGGSTGAPVLAAMLDDALAIADATGVRAEDLVVYGRSVGSLYALHVASQRNVKALVLESGIADVLERLVMRVSARDLGVTEDELREAVAASFDHRAKMEKTTCPVLVLHTRGDTMVRPRHAEALASWAGTRAELVLYERGDHNSIHAFNGDDIVRRVVTVAKQ